jgi:hypothetical protein
VAKKECLIVILKFSFVFCWNLLPFVWIVLLLKVQRAAKRICCGHFGSPSNKGFRNSNCATEFKASDEVVDRLERFYKRIRAKLFIKFNQTFPAPSMNIIN